MSLLPQHWQRRDNSWRVGLGKAKCLVEAWQIETKHWRHHSARLGPGVLEKNRRFTKLALTWLKSLTLRTLKASTVRISSNIGGELPKRRRKTHCFFSKETSATWLKSSRSYTCKSDSTISKHSNMTPLFQFTRGSRSSKPETSKVEWDWRRWKKRSKRHIREQLPFYQRSLKRLQNRSQTPQKKTSVKLISRRWLHLNIKLKRSILIWRQSKLGISTSRIVK